MNDISRIPFLAFACFFLSSISVLASANIDPTNKHAWAENTGWMNFAPTNGGATVYYNGTSGHLTGYAWAENIGWIKLGNNAGGPYTNSSSEDWGVNLNATGSLSGYAWGENIGWIKFDPAHSQVTNDMATGQLDGYAWGENIGWIHFKGNAPVYNVRTWAFDKHPLGTPDWWLSLYNVDETSNPDSDPLLAWQEYVADTDPTNPESFFHIEAISYVSNEVISNLPPTIVSFQSSPRRFYTLIRSDDLKSGIWTNVPNQTGIQGTGGLDSLQDTNTPPRQFYRVDVKLTP